MIFELFGVLFWFGLRLLGLVWFALGWVGSTLRTHLTVYGSVLVSMIRCFMILVSSLAARSTFHSHVNLFFVGRKLCSITSHDNVMNAQTG